MLQSNTPLCLMSALIVNASYCNFYFSYFHYFIFVFFSQSKPAGQTGYNSTQGNYQLPLQNLVLVAQAVA